MHRRSFLLNLAATTVASRPFAVSPTQGALLALETRVGGRLGVCALDTGSGRQLGYRADERFIMCSMFKLPLAAAILARVDAGVLGLTQPVPYSSKDLLPYAPVTSAHVQQGSLSMGELCAAIMEVSDNTAANLLLAQLGGPAAMTRFVRAQGDNVTRMDRIEPAMNEPSGDLDTTTPRAFALLARTLLLGDTLRAVSRAQLTCWLTSCTTGKNRLRAGFPQSWTAGDRSGTGDTELNDTAVAWPPFSSPLVVSALYRSSNSPMGKSEHVLHEVGSIVASWAAKG